MIEGYILLLMYIYILYLMYSICTIDISIISFNKLFIRVLLMKGAKVQRYNTNGEEKKSDLMMRKTQHSHHREKKKRMNVKGNTI